MKTIYDDFAKLVIELTHNLPYEEALKKEAGLMGTIVNIHVHSLNKGVVETNVYKKISLGFHRYLVEASSNEPTKRLVRTDSVDLFDPNNHGVGSFSSDVCINDSNDRTYEVVPLITIGRVINAIPRGPDWHENVVMATNMWKLAKQELNHTDHTDQTEETISKLINLLN